MVRENSIISFSWVLASSLVVLGLLTLIWNGTL